RQDLKRHILRLVGSKGTAEQEDLRGWMALDWLVRVHAPAWLRLAGLDEHADRLARFAEVRPDTVQGVKPALDAALEAARAARDTAEDIAWCPAWDAEIAAREAARTVARAAAWGTAWDTAWGTAWDAAWGTAWAAAGAAKEQARRELQQSAHELVDRMLAVTEGDPA